MTTPMPVVSGYSNDWMVYILDVGTKISSCSEGLWIQFDYYQNLSMDRSDSTVDVVQLSWRPLLIQILLTWSKYLDHGHKYI